MISIRTKVTNLILGGQLLRRRLLQIAQLSRGRPDGSRHNQNFGSI